MLVPIDIVGGSYKDVSRAFDQQDCVNWLPEAASSPAARSQSLLRTPPGLTRICGASSGAVRGLRNVEGNLYAVIGGTLYSVSNSYALTSLGTISGLGRVSMTHNQITGGYELVIVTGTTGYVYNTATSTLSTITDDAFPGSIICDYINSYIAHIEPERRYWFHSDLAAATSYISTDRYEAESSPDLMVSLVADHQQIVLFGERTTQFFVNEVSESAAFQNASGTVIEQGCAATHSPVKLAESVFWLGNNGVVYRLNGYAAVPISTPAIEQAIANLDWSEAFGMAWTDRGHHVYYLTFPDGGTWGYDVTSGLWHRRESYGLDRWRVNCMTRWNNQWVCGDYTNGSLYFLDWDNQTENNNPLVSKRISGYLAQGQNPLYLSTLELIMSTGQGGTGGDNWVSLRYSDDGGASWSSYRQSSLGATGEYAKPIRFRRLGRFRSRIFEISVSSPVRRDLIAASLEMEAGQ